MVAHAMLPRGSTQDGHGSPNGWGGGNHGSACAGYGADMPPRGWLLCWLPLAAGLVSQPRLPVLAGTAAMTAIARRAPLELTRCTVKLSTEELDTLIDDVTKVKASKLIIRPYDPEGAWLWTQWSGSLLQLTRWKVLGLAALAGANCAVVNNALQADWPLFAMPGPSLDAMIASEPLVARLESLSTVWEYQLTLCTFVVTFFLNQAWQHAQGAVWAVPQLGSSASSGRA
jgi:hypothetical protein